MNLVMTKIDRGIQVHTFKPTADDVKRYAKHLLANKGSLIFAIEDIEIPQNLTAKGLIQFAEGLRKTHTDDLILKQHLM